MINVIGKEKLEGNLKIMKMKMRLQKQQQAEQQQQQQQAEQQQQQQKCQTCPLKHDGSGFCGFLSQLLCAARYPQ